MDGASANWRVLDVRRLIPAITPATFFQGPSLLSAGAKLNPNGFQTSYNDDTNYTPYNFDYRNDVISAYGMLNYEFNIGLPVRGALGLRYEHTNKRLDALNRIRPATGLFGSPNDFALQRFNDKYDEWLPSGVAILDITDKFLVRFAGYETYVRPQPRQFSPNTAVGIADPLTNVRNVTLGNPNLRPYKATSFDLSVEWYNRPKSLIAFNVFQKRIDGLIRRVAGARNLCPADGGNLGLGPLQLDGDFCRVTNGAVLNGQLPTVNISGFVNADAPYTVRGAEVNIQQNLDFLPSFLSNLGGGFNASYTKVKGETITGAKLTLPGVSKYNVNAVGYYETDRFGVRVNYNFRSKYDVPEQLLFFYGGNGRQVKPRGQLDASANVNLMPGVSLSVSGFNLTNAAREDFQGVEEQTRRVDFDGRTYRIALNAAF